MTDAGVHVPSLVRSCVSVRAPDDRRTNAPPPTRGSKPTWRHINGTLKHMRHKLNTRSEFPDKYQNQKNKMQQFARLVLQGRKTKSKNMHLVFCYWQSYCRLLWVQVNTSIAIDCLCGPWIDNWRHMFQSLLCWQVFLSKNSFPCNVRRLTEN